jgi:cytochrome P450
VFRDPLVFQPDRWNDRGPQAYLPFGAGLHACPGSHLGMVLISAALSAVLARWTVSSYRGGLPDPRSTLVPRDFTVVLSPPQGAAPQAETWDERASTR